MVRCCRVIVPYSIRALLLWCSG